MNALAARRRHPAAIAILLLLGLVLVGAAYSLLAPKSAQAQAPTADAVADGRALFLANCATCHGLNAQGTQAGPTLVGVGAASVSFQVGTGRMPLAGPGVQAQRQDEIKFSEEQIAAHGGLRRLTGPGARDPHRGAAEHRRRRRRAGRRAVPGQLCDVPQLRRVRRGAHARQVRADAQGRHEPGHLRGDADRSAVDAGVQRPEHHAGEQEEHHRVHQRDPVRRPTRAG